jgi:general secretion pathway protein K
MKGSVLRQEKGMVLLLVLTVVALLSALLVEFAFSGRLDLRLAETYRDSTRAYYLASGGIRAGQMLLHEGSKEYDAREELWGRGVANFPVGDGFISIGIEDLDGRLAINALVAGNNPQTMQMKRFSRLFENLELDSPDDLVAALIDWLDSDDEVYNQDGKLGAESDYYQRLDSPYQTRNGPLVGMEELLLVRGFTPEVVERISPFVAIHGDMRVNLNTAPPEVIATLYFDDEQPVSLEEAQSIVAARDLDPFEGHDDFKEEFPALALMFPTSGNLNYSLKYTSEHYRIRSQARINDGTRTVTAVVRKSNNSVIYRRVD